MPTVHKENGFRFFFYSNEHLPKHIHVEGKGGELKISLESLTLMYSFGLRRRISENGMNFMAMKTVKTDIKIRDVFFRDEKVFFSLEDGREIGAPLEWYPRLYKASQEELLDFSISPGGYRVHWNRVDEDLSAYGMLTHNLKKNTQLL